jgi:hypothetical protein
MRKHDLSLNVEEKEVVLLALFLYTIHHPAKEPNKSLF